jgi:uncharacterized protein with NRDE domain
MCLIVFAYKYHPGYPLILAANRDEFYERPTRKAHFWKDHPDVLAGRDMKYGGAWMGITRTGRFAAITNFRDMREFREHALSRGLMVKEFLTNRQTPEEFLKRIIARQDEYNGFNLLLGDTTALFYYSNRDRKVKALKPGIYSLSNHLLDTPWPKTQRSRMALAEYLKGSKPVDPEYLFEILSDTTIAHDHELPDTGFGLEWERILSAPFIATPTYGTRSSTVLLMDTDGFVRFEERSFEGPQNGGITSSFEFRLSNA